MKHSKFALSLLLGSAIMSSSCSMLAGLLGGGGSPLSESSSPVFTGLTDEPASSLSLASGRDRLGYVASSSAPSDPSADAGYLYGIFKAE
jgi:hypothetical protein